MSSKSEKSDKSRKFDSQVGRVGNGRKSTTEVGKREEKQQSNRAANNTVSSKFRMPTCDSVKITASLLDH